MDQVIRYISGSHLENDALTFCSEQIMLAMIIKCSGLRKRHSSAYDLALHLINKIILFGGCGVVLEIKM